MTASKSQNKYDAVIATPLSDVRLGLHFSNAELVAIDFLDKGVELKMSTQTAQKKIIQQISNYFLDPGNKFDFDLRPEGTLFQQRVWRAMCKIPVGKTLTYGELAKRLGTSARAIGNACRTNKIPILIPCHRIVARTGLGGYMGHRKGSELDIKKWLLQHEHALNGG